MLSFIKLLACLVLLCGTMQTEVTDWEFAKQVHDDLQELGFEIVDPQPLGYENCGTSDDDFILENVDIVPYPPVKGQILNITVNGTVVSNITQGSTGHILVKYWIISVVQKDFDLCQSVSDSGYQCPIGPGPLTFSEVVPIYDDAPSGSYSVVVNAKDVTGKQIFCLKFGFSL